MHLATPYAGSYEQTLMPSASCTVAQSLTAAATLLAEPGDILNVSTTAALNVSLPVHAC